MSDIPTYLFVMLMTHHIRYARLNNHVLYDDHHCVSPKPSFSCYMVPTDGIIVVYEKDREDCVFQRTSYVLSPLSCQWSGTLPPTSCGLGVDCTGYGVVSVASRYPINFAGSKQNRRRDSDRIPKIS